LDVENYFASRFGRETSGLTKEYLAQAALFNTTTFGAGTPNAGNYDANFSATPKPIQDIIASTRRLKAKGEPGPYVVVMSGAVWEHFRTANQTISFVTGTLKPGYQVTLDEAKTSLAAFGVSDILIGDAYVNTAADGATPSLSPVWSNSFIWVGRPGLAATDEKDGVSVPQLGGVGATMFWEGFTPGGVPSTDKNALTFEGGNYVESYPAVERDSMILRLKMSSFPYIGNARAGDLIAVTFTP
jgi:hypothetical protein